MVVSVQSFYGPALPRPFFVFDNRNRASKPDVNGALLEWARDAPFTAGGLNMERRRFAGRTEGKLGRSNGERKNGSVGTARRKSAYYFFFKENLDSLKGRLPAGSTMPEISKAMAQQWRELEDLKREKYVVMAAEDSKQKGYDPNAPGKPSTLKSLMAKASGVVDLNNPPMNRPRRGKSASSSTSKRKKTGLDSRVRKSAFARLLRKERSSKSVSAEGMRMSMARATVKQPPKLAVANVTAAAAAAATKRSRSKSSTFAFPADSDEEETSPIKLRRLRI